MSPNSSLENAFRTHLASALGYYHHLLCRLQSEFDVSLTACVDFHYIPESKTRELVAFLSNDEKFHFHDLSFCHLCRGLLYRLCLAGFLKLLFVLCQAC